MGKRFSQETKSEAIRLYRSGLTLAEVSMRVGASRQVIKNWLDAEGGTRGYSEAFKIKTKKGRGVSRGQKVWDKVEALYGEGKGSVTIARELSMTPGGVLQILRRRDLVRDKAESGRLAGPVISKARRVYAVNEDAFMGELDRHKAWVLGVIYGDGSIIEDKGETYVLEVSGDKDVCQKVRSILDSEHRVFPKGGCFILRIGSKWLAESLERWGVVPRKSNILEWPKGLPIKLESHFVRGLIDSDGGVYGRKKGGSFTIQFGSTSRLLHGWVVLWMNVFCKGGDVPVHLQKPKKKTHSPFWRSSIYAESALKFGQWFWHDSDDSMRGKRKYGIFVAEAEKRGMEVPN